MERLQFTNIELFAKKFIRLKTVTLFLLKRYFTPDLAFFIKNNVFNYILIEYPRERGYLLKLLDFTLEKYDSIELNKVME